MVLPGLSRLSFDRSEYNPDMDLPVFLDEADCAGDGSRYCRLEMAWICVEICDSAET